MTGYRFTGTFAAVVFLCAGALAPGQEFKGAEEALKRLGAQGGPGKEASGPTLAAALREYQRTSREMPPAQAAAQWLALADRYLSGGGAMGAMEFGGGSRQGFKEVLAALPPPSAWDALASAIEARTPALEARKPSDTALLILAHVLRGDREAQWREVRSLRPPGTGSMAAYFARSILALQSAVASASGDPAKIVQILERQLALPASKNEYGGPEPQMPDLVTLLGRSARKPCSAGSCSRRRGRSPW